MVLLGYATKRSSLRLPIAIGINFFEDSMSAYLMSALNKSFDKLEEKLEYGGLSPPYPAGAEYTKGVASKTQPISRPLDGGPKDRAGAAVLRISNGN